MWETDSAKPSLRVLQCVDPSAGLRFSVQSRIRASNLGVSVRGPCPAWRLNSPASRSCPNRLLQRSINASLQSSLSRICAQLWPASSSNISRARRPSSARPLRLVARWLNSIRSDSDSSIVLFMSTIILPFQPLQTTSFSFSAEKSPYAIPVIYFGCVNCFTQTGPPSQYALGMDEKHSNFARWRFRGPARYTDADGDLSAEI